MSTIMISCRPHFARGWEPSERRRERWGPSPVFFVPTGMGYALGTHSTFRSSQLGSRNQVDEQRQRDIFLRSSRFHASWGYSHLLDLDRLGCWVCFSRWIDGAGSHPEIAKTGTWADVLLLEAWLVPAKDQQDSLLGNRGDFRGGRTWSDVSLRDHGHQTDRSRVVSL